MEAIGHHIPQNSNAFTLEKNFHLKMVQTISGEFMKLQLSLAFLLGVGATYTQTDLYKGREHRTYILAKVTLKVQWHQEGGNMHKLFIPAMLGRY